MFEYPAVDGVGVLAGHLDLVRTEVGWQPWRLPRAAVAQFPPKPGHLLAVTRQAAGVRLLLSTTATRIELDVRVTRMRIAGVPIVFPPGLFDMVVDGELVASEPASGGAFEVWDPMSGSVESVEGDRGSVIFAGLSEGRKEVEIWFPQQEAVELIEIRADAPIDAPATSKQPVWLHHGSSISQCAAADSPTGTWPAIAARQVGLNLVNVGLGGNAVLDPFVARALASQPADVISIKMGINIVNGDTMRLRSFVPAMHGFLDLIREGHPQTPLLVISPILCPIAEATPGPTVADISATGPLFEALGDPGEVPAGRLTLEVIRAELENLVAQRRVTDPFLHYLDGRELYGPEDIASHPLPDRLHPDAPTYRLMGERFAERVFAADGILPVESFWSASLLGSGR